MQQYLTRSQAIGWYNSAREEVIEEIKGQGAGKIKYQCPLCPGRGDLIIVPDFESEDSSYKVSFFCAECGFRIDETGLKYFPPPPPPEHLRHPKKR